MSKFTKVIFIGVAILYLWCLYVYLNTPVRTDIVKYGLLEDSENTTAYVIRKENIVYANIAGSFKPVLREGEKIAKGSNIITVYKNNTDQKMQDKITELDERIANIKNSQTRQEIFAGDIQKLEDRIDDKVNEIIDLASNAQISKVIQIKEDINKILIKKLTINGEKGASGYQLQELKKEKEKYESQLRTSKIDLIAETSGVVSYNIDQMEQILNPDNIRKFTPSDFMALDNIKFDESVQPKAGQPVVKIIDNFDWYLGYVTSAKKTVNLKEGDPVKVRFYDFSDTIIDARVHYISPEEKEKVVIVLQLNKHVEFAFQERKLNAEIIQNTYSGFKIPISAIRLRDGKTGAFVIRERAAKFCELEILYKNNDFAIVKENNLNQKGLLLYDEIILKSGEIEDGTLIR